MRLKRFENYKFKKYKLRRFESISQLEQEYISLYGEPKNEEEIAKMKDWINSVGNFNSFQEMQRLANTGAFDNRLKTWENTIEEKSEELKQKWINKNGKPDTKEKQRQMMRYIWINNYEKESEPPVNYFGEETRQIPHF